MSDVIAPVVLGIVLVILGRQNRKGHLGSLHWYHRRRVTEENRLPFGKMVGNGTMLCGFGLLAYGGFVFLSTLWAGEIFIIIGTVILSIALAAGLGLSIYAMFKYNKGIF